MKKSNLIFKRLPSFKMGFLPILLTFLFFAALQIDMKAQNSNLTTAGQTIPPARVLHQVPAGPFVTVNVAKDRLLSAITNLKGRLEQYAPGTAPYDAAFLRYTNYTKILELINSGKTVGEAISEAARYLTTDGALAVTQEVALVERNAAVTLLKL